MSEIHEFRAFNLLAEIKARLLTALDRYVDPAIATVNMHSIFNLIDNALNETIDRATIAAEAREDVRRTYSSWYIATLADFVELAKLLSFQTEDADRQAIHLICQMQRERTSDIDSLEECNIWNLADQALGQLQESYDFTRFVQYDRTFGDFANANVRLLSFVAGIAKLLLDGTESSRDKAIALYSDLQSRRNGNLWSQVEAALELLDSAAPLDPYLSQHGEFSLNGNIKFLEKFKTLLDGAFDGCEQDKAEAKELINERIDALYYKKLPDYKQLLSFYKQLKTASAKKNGGLPDDLPNLDRFVEILKCARAILSPRELDVIMMCFGFDGDGGKTLIECGEVLRLSRERVRQIKQKALRKLAKSTAILALFAEATNLEEAESNSSFVQMPAP